MNGGGMNMDTYRYDDDDTDDDVDDGDWDKEWVLIFYSVLDIDKCGNKDTKESTYLFR